MTVLDWLVVGVPALFIALGFFAHTRDKARRTGLRAKGMMRNLRALPRVEDARRSGRTVRFRTALGGGSVELDEGRMSAASHPGLPHLVFENGRVRGRNLGLAQLALDDRARFLVGQLGVKRLWTEGDRLHLTSFKTPEAVLAPFLDLADHLPGDAWGPVATALGLTRRGVVMTGVVDDVAVTVRATPEGQTEIQAAAEPGFQATREPPFRTAPVGHPILDGLIGVWAVEDRDRLDDAELVEALLDVVHAHPGSSVEPLGIRLVEDGLLLDELVERVHKVVRLARVLDS